MAQTMDTEQIKETAIKKGLKIALLVCVSADNNNKYYSMYQTEPDSFMVIRGRVDVTSIIEGPYPMSKWDATYRDKTKENKKPKPYTDLTHLFEAKKPAAAGNASDDSIKFNSKRHKSVIEFVELLQMYANKSVKENYTVSAKNVTKKQIDEAQNVLNQITGMLAIGADINEVNKKFLELYQIIPRRMSNVKDHLLQDKIKDDKSLKEAQAIVTNEQETLDVMAGQVALEDKEESAEKGDKKKVEKDILELMGLDMEVVDAKEEKLIKELLGGNAKQYKRAYRAVNRTSEEKYNKNFSKAKDKKTLLLWHGSRNENWWSIFQQSLKIRPTNAVHTGSMFGDGIYHASKAQKSIGYTSLNNSYFAKGTSRTAILALYEVHVGKQQIIERWKNEHSRLNHSKISKDGFDSVWAKGGYDLRNDEFITYQESQCTIKYLVEIGS